VEGNDAAGAIGLDRLLGSLLLQIALVYIVGDIDVVNASIRPNVRQVSLADLLDAGAGRQAEQEQP
jgi:hypothetical protein